MDLQRILVPTDGSTLSKKAVRSAVELAESTGISRGTARRYLEYLALTGAVELSLRYGSAGRPEHKYRWADRVTTG